MISVIGGTLIVISGLFLLRREAQLKTALLEEVGQGAKPHPLAETKEMLIPPQKW